jgi:hypothetical protein
MSPRRPKSTGSNASHFFTDQLMGETPPSLPTMERLYALSAKIYELRPWELLEEGELVLTRDSETGETCYCAVMGALGQVVAVHAYIGVESYRLFRRMLAGEVSGAGEFYEVQRSVSLEFVPARELDAQDRKLLTALRHPIRSAGASPVFRAGRPGFFPWYVTEQEARLLEECLRAVIVICSAVSANPKLNYWERHYTYPLVSRVDGKDGESRYSIEMAEATLPQEPPLAPAHLGPEQVRQLRNRDYPVRGTLELDHFSSGAKIGEKNERKACVRIAMAVDAESGFLFSPELAAPDVSVADALGMAIIRAAEASHALPKEVRVSNRRFKDCLQPLSELCGFPVKVARSLPALAEAREALLRMMGASPRPET